MEVATINVESREATGTNKVRNLRNTGKIPMVLYGGGQDSISLQAEYDDVKPHLGHHLRVFQLNMGSKAQASYLQHVQWDCLTDEPLHLDFQRIDMSVPLKMDIELTTLGNAKGIAKGGRMVRDVQNLHLACLPAHVPEQIEVKVGEMECGDKIYARDIELPEGCELDMPGDRLVLHVTEAETKPEEELDPDADPAADASSASQADAPVDPKAGPKGGT